MDDNKKFCVIGVGGAGCRVISHLVNEPGADKFKLIAIDTDKNSLDSCGLAEEDCIVAGAIWRNGRGTGGSVIDGQRALSHERKRIEEMIRDAKMLIICAGLGGGTASGGVQIVLSCASNLHIPAVTLVTMPFSVEGGLRQKTAEQALNNEIIRVADAVIPIPNDLLFAGLDPATPLAEAFRLADCEMARSVMALSTVLTSGNLLNADFSDFSALLWRKKSRCALGIGVIDTNTEGEEFTAEKAFSKLLESPLLGGPSTLCDADAVIFTLTGGEELSLQNAQSIFSISSSHIGKKTKIMVGAAVSPDWQGKFQYTALAVRYEQERIPESTGSGRKKSKRAARIEEDEGDMVQQSLPLAEAEFSRGIMENTTPVRWNNEELDIPTFQRKNLIIDTGKNTVS